MKLSRIVMSFSFLLLFTGSALAQKVSVDFDRAADFSKYRTFALAMGAPAANPMVHQRIVAGIEAQLISKGLRRVEINPDIVVIYHAATDTRVSINAFGNGPYGGWRFGSGTATVSKVPVGELVIDIGDVRAQRLVWRATASGTLSSKQAKNQKALAAAIAEMFENYPYPAGKK